VSAWDTAVPERLRTVLLVDDNQADVDLMVHALRSRNLVNQIDVVRDGAEAIEYLFVTGRYAGRTDIERLGLVLLDLKLPLVDGLEVLARVKADPRTAQLPVVVLTSSAEDRDLKTAYRLGANSYIVKPIDFDRFMESAAQVGMYWLMINQPVQVAAATVAQATAGTSLRVLLVEDSAADATMLEYELGRAGYDVSALRVDSAQRMEAALAAEDWELIISDFTLPGFVALDALEIARRHDSTVPFIVVSGTLSDQAGQSVLRAGANDYLSKDDLRRLASCVARLLADGRQAET
jgi:two-component system, response regulator